MRASWAELASVRPFVRPFTHLLTCDAKCRCFLVTLHRDASGSPGCFRWQHAHYAINRRPAVWSHLRTHAVSAVDPAGCTWACSWSRSWPIIRTYEIATWHMQAARSFCSYVAQLPPTGRFSLPHLVYVANLAFLDRDDRIERRVRQVLYRVLCSQHSCCAPNPQQDVVCI